MKKFITLTSTCAPLELNNVDTDQMMPARFLLIIEKTGFGKYLFHDWRYLDSGKPNRKFVLNKPQHKQAKILLAGENFGSGSSREHAVWAVTQYGFRAVICISCSDIFRYNAYSNNLLVITLRPALVKKLFKLVKKNPKYKVFIDLPNQVVRLEDGSLVNFDINQFFKEKYLEPGRDNVDYVLSRLEKIKQFERKQKS